MSLTIYNTLTRKREELKPRDPNLVRIYNCGPTVYSRQHIGNYRAFAEWDLLHRSLLYLGYKVERVTNITDVGHMSKDEDFGEDKMEKSAKEEGKSPLQIADEVIVTFMEDLSALNILNPDGSPVDPQIDTHKVQEVGWTRATDYIEEMIETNKMIEKSGYTYETDQALYFDVTKFDDYTKLSGQRLEDKEVGSRDEVEVDPGKKNPADFVLWMKLVGKYKNHIMQWDSPWGRGFPGWHIECSAMGCTELGEYIDIHTGGIEHIGVHHPNEIAQNFGAYGHSVVGIWLHNDHLLNKKGAKMAKSEGTVYTLPELEELGYDPLDLRYYYLSVKYRQPLYFSLEGLDSAKKSLKSLRSRIDALKREKGADKSGKVLEKFKKDFKATLEDDLNISKALATLNDLLKSDEEAADILATVEDFDSVLGLKLISFESDEIGDNVKKLLNEREEARKNKDFDKSDTLRCEIEKLGYEVLDTSDGQVLRKL